MRMRRGVAGVLLLVLGVAGCGSGASPSAKGDVDTLSVIDAAAQATSAARSMRVSGALTEHLVDVSVPTTGQTASIDMKANFTGDLQTSPLAGRISMSDLVVNGQSFGDGIEEIITPDGFYMKMPQLATQLGKPWLGMKFDDISKASGVDFGQLISQAKQMQPAQYIQQLARSGDVARVGTETVNGTATTHYAGSVKLAAVLGQYPPDLRRTLAPVMRSAGFTGVHLDAWIDGDGLVRRITSASEGGNGSIAMSMDVLAYDVTVDAGAPPADQVADFGQLSAGLQ